MASGCARDSPPPGGFAAAFDGTRVGGSQVAVKRLFEGMSQQYKLVFQREMAMMCQLTSEFVVSVLGLVDDPPDAPMLLVM